MCMRFGGPPKGGGGVDPDTQDPPPPLDPPLDRYLYLAYMP